MVGIRGRAGCREGAWVSVCEEEEPTHVLIEDTREWKAWPEREAIPLQVHLHCVHSRVPGILGASQGEELRRG